MHLSAKNSSRMVTFSAVGDWIIAFALDNGRQMCLSKALLARFGALERPPLAPKLVVAVPVASVKGWGSRLTNLSRG